MVHGENPIATHKFLCLTQPKNLKKELEAKPDSLATTTNKPYSICKTSLLRIN